MIPHLRSRVSNARCYACIPKPNRIQTVKMVTEQSLVRKRKGPDQKEEKEFFKQFFFSVFFATLDFFFEFFLNRYNAITERKSKTKRPICRLESTYTCVSHRPLKLSLCHLYFQPCVERSLKQFRTNCQRHAPLRKLFNLP